jgi:hypothetical protein
MDALPKLRAPLLRNLVLFALAVWSIVLTSVSYAHLDFIQRLTTRGCNHEQACGATRQRKDSDERGTVVEVDGGANSGSTGIKVKWDGGRMTRRSLCQIGTSNETALDWIFRSLWPCLPCRRSRPRSRDGQLAGIFSLQ